MAPKTGSGPLACAALLTTPRPPLLTRPANGLASARNYSIGAAPTRPTRPHLPSWWHGPTRHRGTQARALSRWPSRVAPPEPPKESSHTFPGSPATPEQPTATTTTTTTTAAEVPPELISPDIINAVASQASGLDTPPGTVAAAINSTTEFFQAYFDLVHAASGLPWAAAIPLSAILIRSSMFFLFTLPALKASGRRTVYAPRLGFTLNWTRNLALSGRQDSATFGPTGNLEASIRAQMAERMVRIRREHGLQMSLYKYLPLLPIPVFLCALDTLRRMSGVQAISFFGLRPLLGDDAVREEAASAMKRALSVPGTDGAALDLAGSVYSMFEPSLMAEGALWFRDLTMPDPTHALSIGVFGAMWLIIQPRIEHVLPAAVGDRLGLGPARSDEPAPSIKTAPHIRAADAKLPALSFPVPARTPLATMSLHEFLVRTRDFSLLRKIGLAMSLPRFAGPVNRLLFALVAAAAWLSTQLPAGLVLYWIANACTSALCRISARRYLRVRPPTTVAGPNGELLELKADGRMVSRKTVFKSEKLEFRRE